ERTLTTSHADQSLASQQVSCQTRCKVENHSVRWKLLARSSLQPLPYSERLPIKRALDCAPQSYLTNLVVQRNARRSRLPSRDSSMRARSPGSMQRAHPLGWPPVQLGGPRSLRRDVETQRLDLLSYPSRTVCVLARVHHPVDKDNRACNTTSGEAECYRCL